MELAPYIDRNSAHEVLYNAVSRDGAVYRGVLVRPDILVSLNDNDPDVVASTEHEAVERLLWIMLNPEDETPEGFVDAKLGDDGGSIRGFFYTEFDEFDESDPGTLKFHGLLSYGSDVIVKAEDVWVRPWSESECDEDSKDETTYLVDTREVTRHGQCLTERGFYRKDHEGFLVMDTCSHRALNKSDAVIETLIKCPVVGELVREDDMVELERVGFKFVMVYTGVYETTHVPELR
jgi:hypothetical protein